MVSEQLSPASVVDGGGARTYCSCQGTCSRVTASSVVRLISSPLWPSAPSPGYVLGVLPHLRPLAYGWDVPVCRRRPVCNHSKITRLIFAVIVDACVTAAPPSQTLLLKRLRQLISRSPSPPQLCHGALVVTREPVRRYFGELQSGPIFGLGNGVYPDMQPQWHTPTRGSDEEDQMM